MKTKDKIRGSLIGGAIGDALGYPVEFLVSFRNIQSKYGANGITRLIGGKNWTCSDSDKALISDDTQMTLFTAGGLLNADGPEQRCNTIRNAYVEWYFTQIGHKNQNSCWIADIPEMKEDRAPGNTCMSALDHISRGKEPVNYSKGCGGVMRTAPIALYGAVDGRMSIEETVILSGQAAEITHLHPLGWLPSSLEAFLLYRLMQNQHPTFTDYKNYIEEGFKMLETLYPRQENNIHCLKELVGKALDLASSPYPDVNNIESIGGGWVGDEALAMALYCVAKYFNDFEHTMIAAVNHAGDSDSVGAVTGNILGTIIGYDAIPQYFKKDLELHDVILKVADDLWNDEKTDHSKPLKPLYNSYKVTDWLFAGEYPGDRDEAKAKEKLKQCLQFGITHFIDLTEDGELVSYWPLLESKAQHLRFPIRDVSVPKNTQSVRRLLEEIIKIHKDNPSSKFYVHCWGGVGRTGIIVACFLGYTVGCNYKEALGKLQHLFLANPKSDYRNTPETGEQEDFVRHFIEKECK